MKQMRQDLAIGAGPFIDDLGELARIDRRDLGRLGQLLRARRVEILARAQVAASSPAAAQSLFEDLGRYAAEDPVLAKERDRFVASSGIMQRE